MWHPGKGAEVNETEVRTSESHAIRVDFVPREEVNVQGRLGMTFAPGMKADTTHGEWRWERDLSADMRKLNDLGTDILVSVMEEHEYSEYGIPDLYEKDRIEGTDILRFAIQDMGIPKEAEAKEYEALICNIVDHMCQGKTVVVHCRGGEGRTGTVTACVLVALGYSAKEAIDLVRKTRAKTIATDDQEEFVYRFAATFEGRKGEKP